MRTEEHSHSGAVADAEKAGREGADRCEMMESTETAVTSGDA